MEREKYYLNIIIDTEEKGFIYDAYIEKRNSYRWFIKGEISEKIDISKLATDLLVKLKQGRLEGEVELKSFAKARGTKELSREDLSNLKKELKIKNGAIFYIKENNQSEQKTS